MVQPAAARWLCLLLWTGTPASVIAAEGVESVYAGLLHSSCWVATPRTGTAGSRQWTVGTAALIDRERRLALTTWHVVRDHDRVHVCFPIQEKDKLIVDRRLYEALIPKGEAGRGRVVVRAEKRDLALIQLDALPPDAAILNLAEQAVRPGQRVHTIGNPGDRLWVCSSRTVREIAFFKIQSEGPAGRFPVEARLILTDLPGKHGESGGPLVNDRGELVGVVQGYREDTRQGCAIDLSEIRTLLASAPVDRIPVPTAGSQTPTSPGEREKSAERRLRFARLLADSGMVERARQVLREIVATYPETPAAAQARKRLDSPP